MKNTLKTVLTIVAIFFVGIHTVSAHAIVEPKQVNVAELRSFSLGIPNEGTTATTGVRLLIPTGLTEVIPNVKAGWTVSTKTTGSGDSAVVTEIDWSAGSIPVGERDDFIFSAQAPASATTLVWKAYQTYADGTVTAWDQAADATPAPGKTEISPYSETTVINDLAATPTPTPTPASTTSNTDKTLAVMSAAALGLAAVAIAASFRRR